jgi:hypothetical protein
MVWQPPSTHSPSERRASQKAGPVCGGTGHKAAGRNNAGREHINNQCNQMFGVKGASKDSYSNQLILYAPAPRSAPMVLTDKSTHSHLGPK